MVHLPRPHLVGTILATFPDIIQTPAPPAAHWAEHLRDRLDPSVHWRIYVDGAWGPRPTPTTENYFWDGNSHAGGGGCIVLMASRAAWEQAPITVLPFSAQSLPADQGGSPFMMELLALTGALQLLEHLQLRGTVYSDCQGLIRKLSRSSSSTTPASRSVGSYGRPRNAAFSRPTYTAAPSVLGNGLSSLSANALEPMEVADHG